MHLVQRLNVGVSAQLLRANEACLFNEQRRYFPKLKDKKRKTRRIPLPPWHPRIARYMKIKQRDNAKRVQPVQPMRVQPDRPRIDNDPDPFAYKFAPEMLYPIHKFEDWPLYPGIRSDQLRYGFTSDDIVACGVDPDSEDYRLIQRALSHHNSNGAEVRKQLVQNEIERWSFHKHDTGNPETQIAVMTLKLRALKARHDKFGSKDKFAFERFGQIYHKRKRKMWTLRDNDFGRYKKIMTYLGLRDRFNPSIVPPGVHKCAHIYSKKKPPGGRRGHIY
mmetsp:Transcript_17094/g.26643  ORF Transcript_17094/g.26643 Transcript_17094/m.26643 type:complete len:277 (+) Transcript_17094:14-844(+)